MNPSRRTIIVSNRLPVYARSRGRRVLLERSGGGLVTGLEELRATNDALWFGTLGGIESERLNDENHKALENLGLRWIDVPPDLYEAYYDGFSNSAIWPLFHYTPDRSDFRRSDWEAFVKVNELFAEAVLSEVREGDRVWVHDYHLLLLPELLRSQMSQLPIGLFLHTPFPTADVFRILPWRDKLLRGMLGADLIGFHTLEYTRHFSESLSRVLGLDSQIDNAQLGAREVRFGAFPMGINTEELHREAHSAEVTTHGNQLREHFRGRTILLGIDRLDYTKGVPERLEAFATLLERNPKLVGKLTLIQVASPTRLRVKEYRKLKSRVDSLVGSINGRFGSAGYVPIYYLFQHLEKPYLLALYRLADVLLVTPTRDRLNLVCKEYVAAKGSRRGVVVLSEFAGAAAEFGGAILVNPWSQDSLVEGMEQALQMSPRRATKMMRDLYTRLRHRDNKTWTTHFLTTLDRVSESNQDRAAVTAGPPNMGDVLDRVGAARRVFVLMDYDGTLVPLASKPEHAEPTKSLCDMLESMVRVEKLCVAIVSGRNRAFLEGFVPRQMHLVSEHGASIRRPGDEDHEILLDAAGWNELRMSVEPVILDFEARIPGSMVERKEFGLVWHYRLADQPVARQQALVLTHILGELLQSTPLTVTQARKAVEVRYLGISKQETSKRILREEGFESGKDLLITLGDDRTDEGLFALEPSDNISINLGRFQTNSTYRMEQAGTLEFLEAVTSRAAGSATQQEYDLVGS